MSLHHIYIHIPFCVKKCLYCSFYSVIDLSLINSFVSAVTSEIKQRARLYGNEELKTLYFGGGTPSLLSAGNISEIYDCLQLHWSVSEKIEFTVEVNPETVTKESLIEYRKIGVNRLSVGVQSFNENELKYLGRIHTARKAEEILNTASKIFDNVNIDIIFGLPNQRRDEAAKNIEEAVKFSPKHISNYELSFESETPLFRDAVKRDNDDPELYLYAKSALENAGYAQYEISNYSLPGYECRHNLAYWSDKSYLGLGPTAHSFDKEKNIRWANTGSLEDYITGDFIAYEEEGKDIDRVIMGLRKTAGMPSSTIPGQFQKTISNLIEDGLLQEEKDMISLTSRGTLLANRVLLQII